MSVIKPFVVVLATCIAVFLPACDEPAGSQAMPPAGDPQAPAAPVESTLGVGRFCNIESVDGVSFAGEPLVVTGTPNIRGWLGEGGGLAISDPTLVVVDGAHVEVGRYGLTPGIERKDVATAFPGIAGLDHSGFELTMPTLPREPGIYQLYLAYSASGQNRTCDNGRRISIVP